MRGVDSEPWSPGRGPRQVEGRDNQGERETDIQTREGGKEARNDSTTFHSQRRNYGLEKESNLLRIIQRIT